MNKHKLKQKEQLGVNPGSAKNKLIRLLLFKFICDTNQNKCFQCGESMTKDNFSIEHKVPWLDSVNPKDLFFDLNNISFSHLSCNCAAARHYTTAITAGNKAAGLKLRHNAPEGKAWCSICHKCLPIENFHKDKSRWNGVDARCAECKNTYRRNKYKNKG